ncbi:hypothetical protein K435DRAFT_711878 [Dendrothele bispora CBS 962.96]|uniref:Uncharacterized protein n=1 Tax=Dendrothele bispora (strain CBS 962.96) TaxID=1314807 RepID=A0A4S8MS72_DENBC|nr:hypothetical protein K435DRAFT_711878 [Dendrothele bispora CBS 962.96]
MFKFRRKESAWEVVDTKAIEPIAMYPELEDEDMDLEAVSEHDTRGTYVFDVKHKTSHAALQKAVVFAQQQLLSEVAKKGYNILLIESWRLTIYRRGKSHRLEIEYCGRPAHAPSKDLVVKPPPYMELLRA